ncbi:SAM-dependent methyltransferase [Streptomyces sp. NPDC005374]|uniref:SAM-dependent methyltransferase n=1 Tax=Streptomyces sp. NPDC005374 TaxID=3364713 RepID=UPI0036812752
MTDTGSGAHHIDTGKPHSARMYDYFLGGKDNYPVDAAAADQVISLFPAVRDMARTNRAFMQRASRLSLVALLHLVADADEPRRIVRELLEPLPPGSHVILSHATGDFDPDTWERVVEVYRRGGTAAQVRSRAEFTGFFEGLEPVDPGVVLAAEWHPGLGEPQGGAEIPLYVGVGRKP